MIECKICKAKRHVMKTHLRNQHGMTSEEYLDLHSVLDNLATSA